MDNKWEYINRVIWGDCLDVMQTIPKEYINLIYIDLPFGFDGDRKFGMLSWNKIDHPENRIDEILPIIPYDIGARNYLRWLYERLSLMRDLLSEDGSIYVHIDWHIGHYVKILMDEVFGKELFRNDIVWCYTGASPTKDKFIRKHDNIYLYGKSENTIFNWSDIPIPYSKETVARTERGAGGNGLYEASEAEKKHKGRLKQDGKIPEDWWIDIHRLQGNSLERVNYPTQKPESLLKRIIKASSSEGGIVADFFCGSGTTGVVAQKLNRKWIMCDISSKACLLARNRVRKELS